MRNLSDLFDPACITLSLREVKKKAVIEELVQLLENSGRVKDARQFEHELMERENLSSTGIGGGIALPHKLSSTMEKTVIAVGRSENGINFDSMDRKPVHLVFLIAGPVDVTGEHLKILSKLSRLLHDSAFRDRLRAVTTPDELVEQFRAREM